MTILAIIINFCILASYTAKVNRMTEPEFWYLSNWQTELLLYGLGFLNLFFGIIVVTTTLAIRVPYNIQKYRVLIHDALKTDKTENIVIASVTSVYTKLTHVYYGTKMVLTDLIILYHILYFFALILGLAYHPFCFSFSLTYIIYRSSTLMKVLEAGYSPRYKILWTLVLFMMVTYFFSIYSYWQLSSDYNQHINNSCYSLFHCLVVGNNLNTLFSRKLT
jgi:hypothetical protein